MCYNSVARFQVNTIDRIYGELCDLGIITVEQILRKQNNYPDSAALRHIRCRLPTHWLQIDVNTDLEKTLFWSG